MQTETHRRPTCEGKHAGAFEKGASSNRPEWCQRKCGKIPFLSYTCARALPYHAQSPLTQTHTVFALTFDCSRKQMHALTANVRFFLSLTPLHSSRHKLGRMCGEKKGAERQHRDYEAFVTALLPTLKALAPFPSARFLSFLTLSVHTLLFSRGKVNIWHRAMEKGGKGGREGWV